MSAIQADYRTNKHIPSRKCYQLIMEVPEESFPEVCRVLGYPATGENVYVGIARLTDLSNIKPNSVKEQTEGEKLRTRAVMLCKDEQFQEWGAYNTIFSLKVDREPELVARNFICRWCNISSRSELTTNALAQEQFGVLLEKYKDWQAENTYADNLSR